MRKFEDRPTQYFKIQKLCKEETTCKKVHKKQDKLQLRKVKIDGKFIYSFRKFINIHEQGYLSTTETTTQPNSQSMGNPQANIEKNISHDFTDEEKDIAPFFLNDYSDKHDELKLDLVNNGSGTNLAEKEVVNRFNVKFQVNLDFCSINESRKLYISKLPKL